MQTDSRPLSCKMAHRTGTEGHNTFINKISIEKHCTAVMFFLMVSSKLKYDQNCTPYMSDMKLFLLTKFQRVVFHVNGR